MRILLRRLPALSLLRLLPALLAALLLLPGCGRRESAVERGIREQILERGAHADVTDLDPQTAVNIAEMDVVSALFEGLVVEDPVDLHPVPGVAERWDVSADGLTYTFFLRRDAKWSDGTAVTAADFVASWQRMLTPSLAAENAGLLYVLQGAEAFHRGANPDFSQVGVTALDPYTLRVRLDHPTPYFLSLLTHSAWLPVPVATIQRFGGLADRGNRWTRPGSLVGNGAFVLKTWRPNQEIFVEQSPTYWDATRVKLKGVRFHPIDSVDAEERAFRAGQLHVTYVLPFGKADAYRRESPQLLRSDAYLNTYFLRLNTARAPFDDVRVRQALGLAVDRDVLVEKVLRAGQRPAHSLTPPGLATYTPPQAVRSDAAEARRLLQEVTRNGVQPLPTLQLLYNTNENLRVVAEALQEMWRRELGLNVEIANQEYKVVLSERRAGRYQILLSDWVGDYLDATTFLDPWRGDSANNHTNWRSADYDALLFAAARNSDPVARARQLQEAETLLLQAAPVVPLYYNAHTFLLHPSVKGWHPTLLDHHPFKHVWLEP
ncbi:peptide ABC transporter substrate-binding protein [Opitutus sp. ER46]|uniref:peptide ABC transporter substrate-binding protein n=1 Tax=Opitutus sp. ER46 TaxID=2161864 RepID=UPI000D30C20A|nr:peptide ABC transporter substrate-binding protein [Opitutus sp. ER46]PTX92549.1 peptide ABC transporter substrate-binding protein [Opitutus sp. ER46]